MLERDRIAIRKWQEEEERAEREPREKSQRQLERTAGALIKVQRENLLNFKDRDIYVSPSLENARMSINEAARFNGIEAAAFVEANGEYFASQHNFELLTDYFIRNEITIFDRVMIQRAWEKFKSVSLLEEPLQPEPAPAPVVYRQQPEELQRVPLSYPRPSGYRRPSEGSQRGFDVNGREKDFTDLEISAMSSEEYKRAFRLRIQVLNRNNFM
jgi:hypothetical protein